MDRLLEEIKEAATKLEKIKKYYAANVLDSVYGMVKKAQMEGLVDPLALDSGGMSSMSDNIQKSVSESINGGSQPQEDMAIQTSMDGGLDAAAVQQLTTMLQNMYKESMQIEALLFDVKKNEMDPENLREIQAIGNKLKNAVSSVITALEPDENKDSDSDDKDKPKAIANDDEAMQDLNI